ncbi:MAG: LLM class flavin-dependent oxidoreductase [Candidatus Dadabacteria bacterium]|nr:LLM class flavin-dependent oxidoreductase [Candidatus Dadabacteria bacterium]
MMSNDSKTGLVIPYWHDITKTELIEIGRLSEELGYDSIWVPELWGRDAFSLLTVLALNTKRVKLGTGIVSVFSRSPAIIAQTMATLDEISEGRMILGLGTSGPIVIKDWHGVEFEKPLKRTREYVEIIRIITSGERVDYDGEIFKLKNFRLQFTPLRKSIPIYIASLGPKNIRLTGEIADGWIPFLTTLGFLKDGIRELIASASAKERDPDNLMVCPYIPACVYKENDLSKRMVKDYIAYYIGGMGTYYYQMISRYGFKDEAERIVEACKKGNKNQAIQGVSDALLDSIAVVGTKDTGKKKLKEYIKAGADLPIIIFPPKLSRDMVRETIMGLAPGD